MAGNAPLSRRERQIMDVLYAHGKAAASDILAAMPDPPSYSAVRTILRILEEKGHVRHEAEGVRYVYSPVVARERARRFALKHLVRTFFEGSPEQAIAALLDSSVSKLSPEQLERLARLIDDARKEGR
jgi:predicted transcriptional regulator